MVFGYHFLSQYKREIKYLSSVKGYSVFKEN